MMALAGTPRRNNYRRRCWCRARERGWCWDGMLLYGARAFGWLFPGNRGIVVVDWAGWFFVKCEHRMYNEVCGGFVCFFQLARGEICRDMIIIVEWWLYFVRGILLLCEDCRSGIEDCVYRAVEWNYYQECRLKIVLLMVWLWLISATVYYMFIKVLSLFIGTSICRLCDKSNHFCMETWCYQRKK